MESQVGNGNLAPTFARLNFMGARGGRILPVCTYNIYTHAVCRGAQEPTGLPVCTVRISTHPFPSHCAGVTGGWKRMMNFGLRARCLASVWPRLASWPRAPQNLGPSATLGIPCQNPDKIISDADRPQVGACAKIDDFTPGKPTFSDVLNFALLIKRLPAGPKRCPDIP